MVSFLRHGIYVSLLALVACGPSLTPQQQQARFCQTLEQVNAGAVDTAGLPELQGHAKVLDTLLQVAPDPIRDDMAQFQGAFAAWAEAVQGEQSMLDTFDLLTDPSLAGAEGRVGDYIAEYCGLRLGGSAYKEAPRPSAQAICPGWPRVGSPLTFNNFPNLPDISGANYFANDFFINRLGLSIKNAFAVEPGGWVTIRGQYPRARYFAYHPNDMDLNNLPTLRDRDIEPDPGSVNPYRQPVAPDSADYYSIKLVFAAPPPEPEPNTRYVGVRKDGQSKNRFVVNLLRLYASDVGDGANSGGVPLPAVTIFDADGEVEQHFEECDLYAEGNPQLQTDLRFPVLPIADHRAQQPPTWSTSSNFEAPSDTLANADVQYLSTYYSRRFGDVFVLRGKYLSAPNTRQGESVSRPDRDVRLYTLCNYNIWAGSAIVCMHDNDLAVDEAGYYTLVISDTASRPANLVEQVATWMDWGPYLDGQITYRHVFRENPLVARIAEGVSGRVVETAMQPYIPRATHCDRLTFERGGWRACFNSESEKEQP